LQLLAATFQPAGGTMDPHRQEQSPRTADGSVAAARRLRLLRTRGSEVRPPSTILAAGMTQRCPVSHSLTVLCPASPSRPAMSPSGGPVRDDRGCRRVQAPPRRFSDSLLATVTAGRRPPTRGQWGDKTGDWGPEPPEKPVLGEESRQFPGRAKVETRGNDCDLGDDCLRRARLMSLASQI
jgi:hypothetical protein